MRTLNVVFEDKEYAQLEKSKGEKNWHDFLIDVVSKNNLRRQ